MGKKEKKNERGLGCEMPARKKHDDWSRFLSNFQYVALWFHSLPENLITSFASWH